MEMTIIIICVLLFLIGVLLALHYEPRKSSKDAIFHTLGLWLMFVFGAISLILSCVDLMRRCPEPPKYYPESEYSLGYIVTECGGKIDTTYVITSKEE